MRLPHLPTMDHEDHLPREHLSPREVRNRRSRLPVIMNRKQEQDHRRALASGDDLVSIKCMVRRSNKEEYSSDSDESERPLSAFRPSDSETHFFRAYRAEEPFQERSAAWQVADPELEAQIARRTVVRKEKLRRLVDTRQHAAAARQMQEGKVLDPRLQDDAARDVLQSIEAMAARRRELSEARRHLERTLAGGESRRRVRRGFTTELLSVWQNHHGPGDDIV